MTVKALKKNNMERKSKSSGFKMKAGKEGPMRKNFPSVFKKLDVQVGDELPIILNVEPCDLNLNVDAPLLLLVLAMLFFFSAVTVITTVGFY